MFVPNFELRHFTPDALCGCVYMSVIVRDRKVKQCLKGCQLSLSKFDFLITYRHKKQANHKVTWGHRYTHAHKYKCLPFELQKVWQNVRNQVVRWKHRKSQSDRSECGWAGKEVWMWKKKLFWNNISSCGVQISIFPLDSQHPTFFDLSSMLHFWWQALKVQFECCAFFLTLRHVYCRC